MNKFFRFFISLCIGIAALLGLSAAAAAPVKAPPTNQATLFFEHAGKVFMRHLAIGVLRFRITMREIFGPILVPQMALSVVEADLDKQILKSLEGVNDRLKKIDEIEKAATKNQQDLDAVTKLIGEVKLGLDETRRLQIDLKSQAGPRIQKGRMPMVSEECAKFLGTLAVAAVVRQGGELISGEKRAAYSAIVERNLGVLGKTALTTSDVPMPVNYGSEVVELVYMYGTARKVGTIYPLGTGVTKLPKLGTDTDWGLLTQSVAVTETNPGFGWVTFTAEKFGGMIRLPTELDNDSIVALGQFIARYAARKIAKAEDYQFFRSTGAGSGVNGTAEGLTKSVVTDSCFVYNTNAASNGGKTKQSDAVLQDFRNLRSIAGLNGACLENSAYYVHPTYEALFCSFNTSATVQPYRAAAAGQAATLDGFPIVWVPVMPAFSTGVSASLVHALFGDASYNYLGVIGGPRFDTSREAAFATDEILIRGLERLTIGKMATDCMAGLRNTAS